RELPGRRLPVAVLIDQRRGGVQDVGLVLLAVEHAQAVAHRRGRDRGVSLWIRHASISLIVSSVDILERPSPGTGDTSFSPSPLPFGPGSDGSACCACCACCDLNGDQLEIVR